MQGEGPESGGAAQYLLARAAAERGLLELVWQQVTWDGLRLTYQERSSGELFVVVRPGSLTQEDEARSIATMKDFPIRH